MNGEENYTWLHKSYPETGNKIERYNETAGHFKAQTHYSDLRIDYLLGIVAVELAVACAEALTAVIPLPCTAAVFVTSPSLTFNWDTL